MKWLIIGEIAVILFLVIGVDYMPYIIAWLPFILYNYKYLGKIARMIPWE